jgi:hypothetical protein
MALRRATRGPQGRRALGAIGLLIVLALPGAATNRQPLAPLEPSICVLTPAVQPDGLGKATALVALDQPTIFAIGRFRSVRIEGPEGVLWQRQGSESDPIEGPIRWPLPPILPGQKLMLRLQPETAGVDQFASIELQGTAAAAMAKNGALRKRLGTDPRAWRQAVEQALLQGKPSLASALLFDFEGPDDPALNALRIEVHRRGCETPTPALPLQPR